MGVSLKEYFAINMITWCQAKFDILSFKSKKFDLKLEILMIRHLLNIETYLKGMCCIILQNFFWCPINQIVNISMFSCFFSVRVFFHRHWRFTGQQGKRGDHLLCHSTTSTRPQTFRHLFATLHVRWLSRIFNRNACIYQAATQWDLPPYWIIVWLIDYAMFVYLLTWWFDFCHHSTVSHTNTLLFLTFSFKNFIYIC